MTLHGHFHNGTIVLDDQLVLPEGTPVELQIVSPPPEEDSAAKNGNEELTVAERLKDFIGILNNAPADAARNHDHYIYGTPKQQ